MKKIVTKPFDREKIPPKQNLFLMPLIWIACRLLTMGGHLKIKKKNMKGLKPPYLVLATHQSFTDFYITPLALFPHRANYVSELEGFENYGEWLYRQVGCMGTRKYVNDLAMIRNIRRIMDRKGILVLYPEAKYANVGTSSALPASLGKLVKMLHVPVVTIRMHGDYLQSPIWNLRKRKGVHLEAEMTRLFTAEQTETVSLRGINTSIREALSHDEYAWQQKRKMKITAPFRAEGLHLPLYQCRNCGTEYQMDSEGKTLFCRSCHAKWTMNEYGVLHQDKLEIKIPDWYEWERNEVGKQIQNHMYQMDVRVHIEALPNAVNFIDCGEGRLQQDETGFRLTFREYGEKDEKTLFFAAEGMLSVHMEYDYRKKGQCITLNTVDNTYFLFPIEKKNFNVTKIMFATETFYQKKHVVS